MDSEISLAEDGQTSDIAHLYYTYLDIEKRLNCKNVFNNSYSIVAYRCSVHRMFNV